MPWAGQPADPTRARAELGYHPRYDLEAAFRDYIKFLESRQ